MFELLCNALLFIFLGVTYFTHVLESKIPKTFYKNPSNLNPGFWPKMIIVLLMICLAANMWKIVKKNKGNPDFNLSAFGKNTVAFLKSKMFLGMLLLIFAAAILETVGFVVVAVIVLFGYGVLLGEKKLVRLAIISVFVALLLHLLFSGLLDVTLPRGTVPFLRNFALFLEGLV